MAPAARSPQISALLRQAASSNSETIFVSFNLFREDFLQTRSHISTHVSTPATANDPSKVPWSAEALSLSLRWLTLKVPIRVWNRAGLVRR